MNTVKWSWWRSRANLVSIIVAVSSGAGASMGRELWSTHVSIPGADQACTDGRLVFLTSEGELCAIDSQSGRWVWRANPRVSGQSVLLTQSHHKVLCISNGLGGAQLTSLVRLFDSTSGAMLLSKQVHGVVDGHPVVGRDGALIVSEASAHSANVDFWFVDMKRGRVENVTDALVGTWSKAPNTRASRVAKLLGSAEIVRGGVISFGRHAFGVTNAGTLVPLDLHRKAYGDPVAVWAPQGGTVYAKYAGQDFGGEPPPAGYEGLAPYDRVLAAFRLDSQFRSSEVWAKHVGAAGALAELADIYVEHGQTWADTPTGCVRFDSRGSVLETHSATTRIAGGSRFLLSEERKSAGATTLKLFNPAVPNRTCVVKLTGFESATPITQLIVGDALYAIQSFQGRPRAVALVKKYHLSF